MLFVHSLHVSRTFSWSETLLPSVRHCSQNWSFTFLYQNEIDLESSPSILQDQKPSMCKKYTIFSHLRGGWLHKITHSTHGLIGVRARLVIFPPYIYLIVNRLQPNAQSNSIKVKDEGRPIGDVAIAVWSLKSTHII